MDVNELKHGDWVLFPNENKPCRIDEYTDGVFNVDNGNLRTKITYVHELQHLLWVFDKGDVEL